MKSLSYLCFLIVEKNKLNRKRHNTYQRVAYQYKAIVPKYRSYLQVEMDIKMIEAKQKSRQERQEILAITKSPKAKRTLKEAVKASGYKLHWGSNGEVIAINPKKYEFYQEEKLDKHQIKRLHDEYLAEAELLGFEVVNPYKKE